MAKHETGEGGTQKTPPLFIILCLTIIAAIGTLLFVSLTLTYVFDLIALRQEHQSLLKLTQQYVETEEPEETVKPDEVKPYIDEFDAAMRQINSDYVCWLKVDGTALDYPVVRGTDNEKYLETSFYGEENIYGAIFMDYRNVGDFVPNIIIYGHNTKIGDMFSPLHDFLDEQYMNEHPLITIKINGKIHEYKIFSARKTTIEDAAYFLDFSETGAFRDFADRCGAPSDASQILTLSTCVSAGDDAERIIVQGVLIS